MLVFGAIELRKIVFEIYWPLGPDFLSKSILAHSVNVKLRFSKNSKKFYELFQLIVTFCGLLRKPEFKFQTNQGFTKKRGKSYLIHNIRTKSNDVPCEYFGHFRLFPSFAESDVIDKSTIAASSIKNIESFIFIDKHCMLSG